MKGCLMLNQKKASGRNAKVRKLEKTLLKQGRFTDEKKRAFELLICYPSKVLHNEAMRILLRDLWRKHSKIGRELDKDLPNIA